MDGTLEKPSCAQKINEALNNNENLSFEYVFQTKANSPFSIIIWNTVDRILKTNLTAKDLFLYDNLSVTFLYDNLSVKFAISVIQYLLYKSWLIVKDARKFAN